MNTREYFELFKRAEEKANNGEDLTQAELDCLAWWNNACES